MQWTAGVAKQSCLQLPLLLPRRVPIKKWSHAASGKCSMNGGCSLTQKPQTCTRKWQGALCTALAIIDPMTRTGYSFWEVVMYKLSIIVWFRFVALWRLVLLPPKNKKQKKHKNPTQLDFITNCTKIFFSCLWVSRGTKTLRSEQTRGNIVSCVKSL